MLSTASKSLQLACRLVAGEWKIGQDSKTLPFHEPSSATILQKCANLGRQDFVDPIRSAKVSHAFPNELYIKVEGFMGCVIAHAFTVALIVSLENSKTFAEAKGEVLVHAASFISWFAEEATRSHGDAISEASVELANNSIVKKLSFTGFNGEGALICNSGCSGRTCVCANKLLVHEEVQDEFTRKLIQRVEQYKLDDSTTQGPFVNAVAARKVDAHAQNAMEKGAVLNAGGKFAGDWKGHFYEPTVISGVTAEMETAHDETFGSRLECDMLEVSTGLMSADESPHGGVKESRLGREGSKYGLVEHQIFWENLRGDVRVASASTPTSMQRRI
ncbi:Aldehyde/histidinol dehydrogenase [Colletotrichum cereale]|nr:Aldehyde/histidinol dehydrogenase [Colletotrichum cereale]